MSAAIPPQISQHAHIAPQYVVVLGITSAAAFLATICVGLRFFQQHRNWGLWWDDWTCLGALILCLGMVLSSVLYATIGHAGYHIWTYSTDQLSTFLKIGMSAEFLYSASVSMSKFSVLFLYRRIFSAPSRSKIYLNILFFLVAGYWVSVYFVLLFAYNPVYAQWQPWLRHTNVKEREFYVAFGIINSTLDIAVLAYPQTRVWKLHISRRRKIFVSLAFLLGGFVCLTSVARIYYLVTFNGNDLPFDMSNCLIWTVLEATVSIICSCLPILYRMFRGKTSSVQSNSASNEASPLYQRGSGKRSQSSDNSSLPTSPRGVRTMIQSSRDHLDPHELEKGLSSPDQVYIRHEFTLTEQY